MRADEGLDRRGPLRGHGACFAVCPKVFDLHDDGYSVVLSPEVPDQHQEAVRTAASQCPERAITVE